MAAKILMVLSASIIFTLGVVHLVYTFWGPNLTPRDPALQISMSQIAPVITKETTMWRCWVGFNASIWPPERIDEVDHSERKDNARAKNHENFCGQDALRILWA